MERETVLILDFGGINNQLLARRIRELNVFSEIVPCGISADEIRLKAPKAIILAGAGGDINDGVIQADEEILRLNIPVLGIGYGHQFIAKAFGGKVRMQNKKEDGKTDIRLGNSVLWKSCNINSQAYFNKGAYIADMPKGFNATAHSKYCPIASMEDKVRKIYSFQFLPEVSLTEQGGTYIKNFLYEVAKVKGDWTMERFRDDCIEQIRIQAGNKKVLCALSGGVDSSVCASLVSKAIGKNLTCIFVDTGLMRLNEGDEVEEAFSKSGGFDLNFVRVNAQARFLERLKRVSNPERKRKIIGEEFIRVFEEEAKKIGAVDFLVQGTIYPDILESGTDKHAVIKSHHNVGGLPDHIDFKELIEPLKELFKDEVRRLGSALGLPERLVKRQPFPGPGLAVRVKGSLTEKKLNTLRLADAIFREEIDKTGMDISQYFAVLTNMRSVGVRKGRRTYESTVALRAVKTTDFMTADCADIPFSVLKRASERITNEVPKVNRVVFDITSKPPATIEWE